MINLNKKLIKIKNNPYVIFKVENFFDDNFYQDIKKLFNDIDTNQLNITENFGKKSVEPLQSNFKNKDHKLILSRLNDIIFSKVF